ncbi:PqiC family protein [Variovorax sp. CYS-02]|uniref:PqiC family protein n=2 Tax=Variovorax terrae TaxID=2923278 RepID=A0A9X1W0E3_9BURK|nr:ABC-type transport auxiliary lipoprotein family protein [Variovorax terrae]MCJ0765392.1 PqiC family protein [Variovorax terrae]
MNFVAVRGRLTRTFAVFLSISALLAGCALPDKPARPVMYDFGPGAQSAAAATRQAPLATLALAEIEASGPLDSSAVLYRLAYADAQQLRPYAQARWSMPPPQLLRQRLRESLGQRRVVLNIDELASLGRSEGVHPLTLRIELEEFSQIFESPERSAGLVRLRATLVDSLPTGDRLLAQRSVVAQRPAPTPDAPGGVRALTAAADAAVEEITQWLQQVR